MRLLRYPAQSAPTGEHIRAGAHEDINTITLLLGAEEAGLELLTRDGRWIPVSPKKGELVITSLTKEALPVIRYRTRDLTRLLPGTARTMRRMERISGRSDDMLIIRGVNVFPSQIEELILKQPGLSPHYVLEVTKDGPLDHLTVVVEGDPNATAGLQHHIKSYIGISAEVKIGAVERSVGKAKRVIDKRPKA